MESPAVLQKRTEPAYPPNFARFGTFQGVFCPTLLTILGVIMFLRLGWVVGHAGLLGAWSIILLASGITLFTALSISTITTNIRIGSGGAFSIISQSLGLEVGGSIGIPLFLCQALAAAMYIFGFRTGWLSIFPNHDPLLVDLATFACLFVLTLISADVAFRIQYVLLGVLFIALASVFAATPTDYAHTPVLFGEFDGQTDYWLVFAVFFPAVTGIMAGLNMSGELRDPRQSIPKGTLWAIVVSTVIYLALAWWCWVIATPEELTENYTVMLDRSLWPWAVTAGLLGATFSSGLSSLVGAPRILQALGQHNVVPTSRWLSRQSSRGEPRNAMLVTGVVVLAALFLRQLNILAPLLTMFFLIAYGMLNLVTLLEQRMNLSSFRPLLKIHPIVPFLGTLGCMFTMVIVHPIASIVAVVLVAAFYLMLLDRNLKAPHGDVRSGMFVSLAEWAAKKVASLPGSERAWRPILLVPVHDVALVKGEFTFLCALACPQGTLKLVGVAEEKQEDFSKKLDELALAFRERELYTTWTRLEHGSYSDRVIHAMQALRGAFFRPNILFLSLPEDSERDPEFQTLITSARKVGLGVLLFQEHPVSHLGCEKTINVWIRDQSPEWQISMDLGNKDMSLLTAFLLNSAWNGKVRVICGISDPDNREAAQNYLSHLLLLSRLPEVESVVLVGTFADIRREAPEADLNILGLPEPVDLQFVRECMEALETTCIFTRDSGRENILA
jgi:solute carrier family 12 sodium/potassium/chloride transporter 2